MVVYTSGGRFDVPGPESDPVTVPLEVSGELQAGDGPRRAVSVRIRNPFEERASVLICPVLRFEGTTDESGAEIFDPEVADLELPPGSSETVEFTVDLERMPENQYPLIVWAVANLQVYTRSTILQHGEKTGNLQPFFR